MPIPTSKNVKRIACWKSILESCFIFYHEKRESKILSLCSHSSNSVGNDEFIRSLIAEAIDKIGRDGIISIESSSSSEISVMVEDGMKAELNKVVAENGPHGKLLKSIILMILHCLRGTRMLKTIARHMGIEANNTKVPIAQRGAGVQNGSKTILALLGKWALGVEISHKRKEEVDIAHPAAKSMIELSRTQDEEVGDGSTSVIVLGLWRLEMDTGMVSRPSSRDFRRYNIWMLNKNFSNAITGHNA
ncbi:hypothetical protein OSB04_032142 [Centaurea solstitialis]|uniref:Uncharacterized protein n=1 Tax=Centaurea solstitialis TaxID=347529 RepID=A0AA38SC56_9ASTR|nr:hypothetical protein OSB04_032142 [Centaurea solstitialis]